MAVTIKPQSQKNRQKRFLSPGRFHRLSVEQYHQMIQAGILGENDRVELLEGWIISKMPHNPPHDATIQLVQREIGTRLPGGWLLRIQSAITLGKSEPEPDLAVVRGPIRRYLKSHPIPLDIGLLMEVAESSVQEDRDYKGPIYARAAIPVYWIVNIPEAQIEVHTEPRRGRKAGYANRQDFGLDDTIPFILQGRAIALIPVRDLLP
jgi:Uma2 family endonuclease